MFEWLGLRRNDDPPDQWVNTDPEMRIETARLKGIFSYWQKKCDGSDMPGRTDIDLDELRGYSGNLMLVDVEHEPLRLRYRYLGTAITATMERDSTGRYYHELYDEPLLQRLYDHFGRIIADRAPLRVFGQAFYPDKSFYTYEAIHLPLSEVEAPVDMVLGGIAFQIPTE